jgi:hypothetical protein
MEDQVGENLASIRENRNAHNILIGKSKGKNHLQNLEVGEGEY